MQYSFFYTLADVAQVNTVSGCEAALRTEQVGHFHLFHPAGSRFLEKNSPGKEDDEVRRLHSQPLSGINVAAELTDGS